MKDHEYAHFMFLWKSSMLLREFYFNPPVWLLINVFFLAFLQGLNWTSHLESIKATTTDLSFNMGLDIMIAIILFVKYCILLSHDSSDFTFF